MKPLQKAAVTARGRRKGVREGDREGGEGAGMGVQLIVPFSSLFQFL